MRPQAQGHAHAPSATDFNSGLRDLRDNAAFANVGAVKAVLNFEGQSQVAQHGLSVAGALAGELWHLNLASVDGKAHGGERGEKCHQHQDQP